VVAIELEVVGPFDFEDCRNNLQWPTFNQNVDYLNINKAINKKADSKKNNLRIPTRLFKEGPTVF
jgi:hypothetical protein